MSLTFDGLTPATDCAITPALSHRPVPIRFVWHHIQPEGAGGETIVDNLVELCDSCHYTIHRLLYALRLQYQNLPLSPQQEVWLSKPPRQAQLAYAKQGLAKCIAAGTVNQIPNEG